MSVPPGPDDSTNPNCPAGTGAGTVRPQRQLPPQPMATAGAPGGAKSFWDDDTNRLLVIIGGIFVAFLLICGMGVTAVVGMKALTGANDRHARMMGQGQNGFGPNQGGPAKADRLRRSRNDGPARSRGARVECGVPTASPSATWRRRHHRRERPGRDQAGRARHRERSHTDFVDSQIGRWLRIRVRNRSDNSSDRPRSIGNDADPCGRTDGLRRRHCRRDYSNRRPRRHHTPLVGLEPLVRGNRGTNQRRTAPLACDHARSIAVSASSTVAAHVTSAAA